MVFDYATTVLHAAFSYTILVDLHLVSKQLNIDYIGKWEMYLEFVQVCKFYRPLF